MSVCRNPPSWAAKNARPPAKLINESKVKAASVGGSRASGGFKGKIGQMPAFTQLLPAV